VLVEIRDYVNQLTYRQKLRVLYVKQTLDFDIMIVEKPAGLASYKVDLMTKHVLGKDCHLQVLDSLRVGSSGTGKVGSTAVIGSDHVVHTCNTAPGDSGSLLWSDGKIVGMHGGEIRAVNYFVPTSLIRASIEECLAQRPNNLVETFFC